MKAWLSISSYVGSVPWASHYMGRLRVEGETINDEIDIEHEITRAEAKAFNKQCKESDDPYRYKAGDTSNRFPSEDAVKVAAVDWLKANRPDVTLVFVGNYAVCDPQEVILGPEPLSSELNKLYKEAEEIDFWENDEAKMESISLRWDALLEKFA